MIEGTKKAPTNQYAVVEKETILLMMKKGKMIWNIFHACSQYKKNFDEFMYYI